MMEHECNYDRRVEAAMATPSRGAMLGSSLASEATQAKECKPTPAGQQALKELEFQLDGLSGQIAQLDGQLAPASLPPEPKPNGYGEPNAPSQGDTVDTIRVLISRVGRMREALGDIASRYQF